MTTKVVLFECGICDSLHPWGWSGDCRDDKNRFASVEDYIEREGEPHQVGMEALTTDDIEIRSMCDRLAADVGKKECPHHEGGT